MQPCEIRVSFEADDDMLFANVALFKTTQEIELTQIAIKEVLKRYFALSYRQREALEAKLFWEKHRNKGFRSLPQFLREQPKQPKKRYPKKVALPPKPKTPPKQKKAKAVKETA